MDTSQIDSRLAALERSAWRWRAACVALAVLACSLGMQTVGAPAGTVRATRFVLVDSSGAEVGSWAPSLDGSTLAVGSPDAYVGISADSVLRAVYVKTTEGVRAFTGEHRDLNGGAPYIELGPPGHGGVSIRAGTSPAVEVLGAEGEGYRALTPRGVQRAP